MKITKVLPGKYRKQYCSVFIDDEYAARLHSDVIQQEKIQSGKELSEAQWDEIKRIEQKKEALEYSYLLLNFRERSEKEMSERLRRKGFSPEIIHAVLEELKEKQIIDDKKFAQNFTESKLKSSKMIGEQRIQQELYKKGIKNETAKAMLQKIKDENPETVLSEDERAYQSLLKRKTQIKEIDPRTLKRRLYGYLLRKGFSYDSVEKALHRLSREGGHTDEE